MVSQSLLTSDFFDLSIYQYGQEQCRPNHSFGPGLRSHYLIHYIISGKGTFCVTVNNQEVVYKLEKGQAFLITPDMLIYYYADAEDPWEYMWIEVDGLKAKEYIGQAGLSCNAPIYNAVSEELREIMVGHLHQIVSKEQMPVPELIGYTYLFLSALIQSSDQARKFPTNRIQEFYVRSTIGFIEQHYMEDITIDDMASALGLSRSYFSKLFKKLTQKSPQDYLIAYRMNKSCELMRSTNMNIGEIAVLVGYNNQFHFSRAFKNFMQQSPNEWRKKNVRK